MIRDIAKPFWFVESILDIAVFFIVLFAMCSVTFGYLFVWIIIIDYLFKFSTFFSFLPFCFVNVSVFASCFDINHLLPFHPTSESASWQSPVLFLFQQW